MTIAFVIDAIYPYNKGGREKRLFEKSTYLATLGYDVHIYCMHWWAESNKDRIENGVNLHAISKLYPLYSGEKRSIKQGVYFGLACLKLMSKKFDIVDTDQMPFFPLYSTWLVCKLRGKKLFATWHEVWGQDYWVEYMGSIGIISAFIERVSVLLPDKIFSNSLHTSTQLINTLHCKKEIVELPIFIDYEAIKSIKPAKKLYDVMFAGRLLKNKRVDLLVFAISILKSENRPVRCLILGQGPEKRHLKLLCNKLGLNQLVTFKDFYENHDDVLAQMKATKVFVSPSEREGFGIVAIEAMACGIPVVANNFKNNAMKDLIIEGVNGFTFDSTPEALAKSLVHALKKFKSQKQSCLDFAKQFDENVFVDRLQKAYEL